MAQADASKAIHAIPPPVASQIKSATVITTTRDAVLGLLENSLDAQSTRIRVTVDFIRRSCTVEDNGLGIHPDSFRDGLCKPHHSSKSVNARQQHGGQGIFLASLAALSLLSVTSKHSAHQSVNSLLVHRGKVLQRQIPKRTNWRHDDKPGTLVTARDILGNVPVRTKRLALDADYDKEWSDLLMQVAALILAWPYQVSISLENQQLPSKRAHFGTVHGHQDHGLVGGQMRLSSREQTSLVSSTMRTVCPDFNSVGNTLVAASARTQAMTIKGLISLTPYPSKKLQFISWGVRPLHTSLQYKALFDAVNKAFSSSTFGVDHSLTDSDQAGGIRESRSRDAQAERKGLDRWPCFTLRIEPFHHGTRFDSSLPLESLCKLLTVLSDGWLRINGFKADHGLKSTEGSESLKRAKSSSGLPSPRKRLQHQLLPNNKLGAFSDWSRIKGGSSTLRRAIWSAPSDEHTGDLGDKKASGPHPTALDVGFLGSPQDTSTRPTRHGGSSSACHSEFFSWDPPGCGDEVRVSLRTGMAVPLSKHLSNSRAEGVHKNSRLVNTPIRNDDPSEPESWLSNMLQTWKNPIFAAQDQDSGCAHEHMKWPLSQSGGTYWPDWTPSHDTLPVQITKEALAKATVIAQVDQKYILVRIPGDQSLEDSRSRQPILCILDQHAASERYILESLLEDMFATSNDPPAISPINGSTARVRTCALSKAVYVQLTEPETEALRLRASHFAHWGILYGVEASKVTVTHLPLGIAERCTQTPKLLIDLLREELHTGSPPRHYHGTKKHPSWLARLGSCPRALLAMLQSRACRSAIMFNDPLSRAECQTLVADLARCAFPFTCAHGRVSVVPLAALPNGMHA